MSEATRRRIDAIDYGRKTREERRMMRERKIWKIIAAEIVVLTGLLLCGSMLV